MAWGKITTVKTATSQQQVYENREYGPIGVGLG